MHRQAPRHRIRSTAVIVGITLVIGIAAGCGGDDDDASTKSVDIETEDGDAKVSVGGDEDEPTVKIETDEGTFSGGGGATLPESFPDDFPLPDDATVQFSGTQETENGDALTVAFTVPDGPKDTWEFFLEELPDAGYDVTEQASGGDGDEFGGTIGFERDGATGAVVVAGQGGESSVSVSINQTS